jgi:hypothetical protein
LFETDRRLSLKVSDTPPTAKVQFLQLHPDGVLHFPRNFKDERDCLAEWFEIKDLRPYVNVKTDERETGTQSRHTPRRSERITRGEG